MEHRDSAWFDALFIAHSRSVFRYVRRRAAAVDTEDLAADVFVTAWRRRDEIPAGAELPWLYRTAGYVLANHHRKHRPVLIASLPDVAGDDHLQWPDDADELKRVFLALSPRDRQILILTAWDGLTGDQLATVLGTSRGGADAALSRARSRLRTAWSDAAASTN